MNVPLDEFGFPIESPEPVLQQEEGNLDIDVEDLYAEIDDTNVAMTNIAMENAAIDEIMDLVKAQGINRQQASTLFSIRNQILHRDIPLNSFTTDPSKTNVVEVNRAIAAMRAGDFESMSNRVLELHQQTMHYLQQIIPNPEMGIQIRKTAVMADEFATTYFGSGLVLTPEYEKEITAHLDEFGMRMLNSRYANKNLYAAATMLPVRTEELRLKLNAYVEFLDALTAGADIDTLRNKIMMFWDRDSTTLTDEGKKSFDVVTGSDDTLSMKARFHTTKGSCSLDDYKDEHGILELGNFARSVKEMVDMSYIKSLFGQLDLAKKTIEDMSTSALAPVASEKVVRLLSKEANSYYLNALRSIASERDLLLDMTRIVAAGVIGIYGACQAFQVMIRHPSISPGSGGELILANGTAYPKGDLVVLSNEDCGCEDADFPEIELSDFLDNSPTLEQDLFGKSGLIAIAIATGATLLYKLIKWIIGKMSNTGKQLSGIEKQHDKMTSKIAALKEIDPTLVNNQQSIAEKIPKYQELLDEVIRADNLLISPFLSNTGKLRTFKTLMNDLVAEARNIEKNMEAYGNAFSKIITNPDSIQSFYGIAGEILEKKPAGFLIRDIATVLDDNSLQLEYIGKDSGPARYDYGAYVIAVRERVNELMMTPSKKHPYLHGKNVDVEFFVDFAEAFIDALPVDDIRTDREDIEDFLKTSAKKMENMTKYIAKEEGVYDDATLRTVRLVNQTLNARIQLVSHVIGIVKKLTDATAKFQLAGLKYVEAITGKAKN